MQIMIEPQIFIPLIPFAIGIVFKALLDMNLGILIVKCLHRINLRSVFRTKAPDISGNWIQNWGNVVSENYKSEDARESQLILKQFAKYFYGEYRIKNDELYCVFGEINGVHIVGKWFDKQTDLGYSGAFEMRIVSQKNILGMWIGHSHSTPGKINSGTWSWKKPS